MIYKQARECKNIEKVEAFTMLIDEMKNCDCCRYISNPIFSKNGEYLINNGEDREEHNYWNYWQGSLDAKIMVIGQDFGKLPVENKENCKNKNRTYTIEECKNGKCWWNEYRDPEKQIVDYETAKKYWGTTDANLYKLFLDVFDIDITCKNDELFFTNIAACYRRNLSQGHECDEWFYLCASKFMGKLIRIIKPEIIITLGRKTFFALRCCERVKLDCKDDSDKKKYNFSDVIEHKYKLEVETDYKPIVFPVFHPGSNSGINRPFVKTTKNPNSQLDDWKNIKTEYERICGKDI